MEKRILVISKGIIHPSIFCRRSFKQMLCRMEMNISYTFASSLQSIKDLQTGRFDAVILYYHEKSIPDTTLAVLQEFARSGGGVMALHSAMASCKGNKGYQELLGGRFKSHDRVGEIHIIPRHEDGDALKGVAAFSVKDELYIHEYHPDNRILLSCDNMGQEEPVFWSKMYGQGRICYFSIGHCATTFGNKDVKRVIQNTLSWITRKAEAL